ncbi:hypothetical protein AB0F88_14405 [Streptosporangium sp. NPDC023963]|uniref:hypothetical protein n=1 Tax=Streptosporangium sp. NPDC023963 TaxID=3155608 RepID=UPI00341D0EBC
MDAVPAEAVFIVPLPIIATPARATTIAWRILVDMAVISFAGRAVRRIGRSRSSGAAVVSAEKKYPTLDIKSTHTWSIVANRLRGITMYGLVPLRAGKAAAGATSQGQDAC